MAERLDVANDFGVGESLQGAIQVLGIGNDFRNHGQVVGIPAFQNPLHTLDTTTFNFHRLVVGDLLTGTCNAQHK